MAKRSCGGCTACCQIVPVRELGTKAFEGCPHTRDFLHAAGPGCAIYERRPHSCRSWSCGWLENVDWEDDLRPDRCGVVLDATLDLILVNGVERPAAQLWVLPGHEEDFRRQPVLALLLALLNHQGVDVLWRMKGGLSRAFRLGADGAVEMSEATPQSPSSLLGGEVRRIARAEMLTKSR